MQVLVLGLGYVGIPVAASLAQAGHAVVGVDIDPIRAEAVNSGTNPLLTHEQALDELLPTVVGQGSLEATTDLDSVGTPDAILVCVDTPVDSVSKEPRLAALESGLLGVAKHLKAGTLVSIESTLPPGTMKGLVQPILEKGSHLLVAKDFQLVHCPERVTAGKLLHNLVHLDRVLGAEDEDSRERAVGLYESICKGTLHPATWIDAELSKTVENAYRDVQLAFANEIAMICHRNGGDVLRVRDLVNSCPGRSMLLPGPGVGGHCLPKDPWLLMAGGEDGERLLPAARAVNDGMTQAVVDLIEGLLREHHVEWGEARVLLLGGAYRENVAETTNAPALRLYNAIASRGAHVRLHDPFVPDMEEFDLRRDLPEAARGVDCAVLVTAHQEYLSLDWPTLGEGMRHRSLVDCRGVVPQPSPKGFAMARLGRP